MYLFILYFWLKGLAGFSDDGVLAFASIITRNLPIKRATFGAGFCPMRSRLLEPLVANRPIVTVRVILTTLQHSGTIFKRELWFNWCHKNRPVSGKWSGEQRYYQVTNIIQDFQLSGSHPYINMIYNFNFHFLEGNVPRGGTYVFKEDKLLTFCSPGTANLNVGPGN